MHVIIMLPQVNSTLYSRQRGSSRAIWPSIVANASSSAVGSSWLGGNSSEISNPAAPARHSGLYQPTWANIAQTAWCRGVIYSPGDGCAEPRQGGEQN